jgi:universal stress protein A
MGTKKAVGFTSIICTTDFSDASDFALDYALTVAEKFGARLTLLHVIDTSVDAAGFYLPHLSFARFEADMKKSAMEKMQKKYLPKAKGREAFTIDVRLGVPHKEIISVAKRAKADLIVMGTYGRTGIDRLVFGSTTARVLKGASCPVLAIPPR